MHHVLVDMHVCPGGDAQSTGIWDLGCGTGTGDSNRHQDMWGWDISNSGRGVGSMAPYPTQLSIP